MRSSLVRGLHLAVVHAAGAALLASTAGTSGAQPVPTGKNAPQAGAPPERRTAAARDAFREDFASRMEGIARGVDGVMGYVVIDLATGDRFERLADQLFPAASTIKIAILYELFAQADEGRLDLARVVPLPATARVGGAGILQELEAPAMPLTDYATLMIVMSDNTATNLLIDTLGVDRINARMSAAPLSLDAQALRLRRRMIDLEAARRGDENVATPDAIAGLLSAVDAGTGLSAAARERVLDILRRPKSTPLVRGVATGVPVASKPGGLEGVAVDAGLVSVPKRPYVFVAMCTWLRRAGDGDRAIEEASRAAYEYFSRLASGGEYGRTIGGR
jgi:beta-lactamase class A